MDKINALKKAAIERRIELLEMIYKAKGGHTGGALSSLDILVTLHYAIMRLDPKNPMWEDRDRFILSKGHSVEGYYTILADLGYFPKEELSTFMQFNTKLLGHPTKKVAGVEMNTGALGHGLPVGVGMAIAGKMDHRDYKVYVLMGDGEQAEGSVWEAAMAGSNYNLDNLVAIVDRNRLQISGNTEDVMKLEPLGDRWASFGWEVIQIDGNDIGALCDTFKSLPRVKGKPHMIIANTTKGKGVSFMENVAKWHHGVPNEEQFNQAMNELKSKLKEAL